MSKVVISKGRYTYCHDDVKEPIQTVDIHNIFIAKNKSGFLVLCMSILLMLLSFFILILTKGEFGVTVLWISLPGFLSVICLRSKFVKKESVVIMATFGVQLETHYWSGRVTRRFVPMCKILKPVLNECVTPVTCYWSLALILCDEDELVLVFHDSRLPLTMLVSVWKALCTVVDCQELSLAA